MAANCVLASLKPSTYRTEYAFGFSLAAVLLATILNILGTE